MCLCKASTVYCFYYFYYCFVLFSYICVLLLIFISFLIAITLTNYTTAYCCFAAMITFPPWGSAYCIVLIIFSSITSLFIICSYSQCCTHSAKCNLFVFTVQLHALFYNQMMKYNHINSCTHYPHQGPEHWENSGRPQYEQATQSLGVVGLHHLDDSQQSLNAWSPQVTHVQTLQIHQAGPAADDTST